MCTVKSQVTFSTIVNTNDGPRVHRSCVADAQIPSCGSLIQRVTKLEMLLQLLQWSVLVGKHIHPPVFHYMRICMKFEHS